MSHEKHRRTTKGEHTVKTLGFGQSTGQIVQMAYVVKDIRASMDWWVRDCRVGPWFLLDSFTGPEQRYRGGPAKADVAIAMAFAGHMQIELIPATPGMDDMFTRYWRASVEWRGENPVRPFG